MTKTACPTEYQEQCALVEWLDLMHIKFSRIAQETWTPSWGQKVRNRKSGLRRGVPDLLIVVPGKRLVFVELKRLKGSKTSPEQVEWVKQLNGIPNVSAAVLHGAQEAIDYISKLL